MGWNSLSLVTSADLGELEPEAIAGEAPWKDTAWVTQRSAAKRDLRIWLEADYSNVPNVADRILDRWRPDYVFGYTGSAYSDLTTAAWDDETGDVALATILATAATDRLYLGCAFEFDGLHVKLPSTVNAAASTLTVKYWAGGTWTALTLAAHRYVDGTASGSATFAQSGRVTWTAPTNWERRTLNGTGDLYYWVEVSVSAALTAGTAADQVLAIRPPDGLKRVAGYLAMAHIMRGLSAQAANPQYWLDRYSNRDQTGYWDQAKALYATLKEKGGIPIDLIRNDVIETEEEKHVLQPVILRRA